MSDNLPNDVLHEIFIYLPLKSLVRFTSVSKSWQSLITSTDFITAHLNQTRLSTTTSDGGNHLLLIRYNVGQPPKKERFSLRIDNDTFDQYDDNGGTHELTLQDHDYGKYFRTVGSCNGLICLSDDRAPITHTVILWNPSIRKSLSLPPPDITFQTHGPFERAVGFGFDSRTNDYKVVRIVYLRPSPIVQLYKLSTGTWETITATTVDPLCMVHYTTTQAFLNGAVHWPANKRGIIGGALIVSFNTSDEVFREIMLPAGVGGGVNDDGFAYLPVAVCGEWLSFLYYRKENYYGCSCSIWVMKEYGVVESWTKLYSIDLNGKLDKMLGFRRNGELLLAMKRGKFVSYDPETREIKYLGVRDSEKYLSPYSFHVGAYAESLVLLGRCKTYSTRRCDDPKEEEEKEDAFYESESEEENQYPSYEREEYEEEWWDLDD